MKRDFFQIARIEAKLKQLISLFEIYMKNYHLAREQYARWGSALVPSIIIHNLSEAEEKVAVTSKELVQVLSKVYNRPVSVPGLEGS